MVCHLSSSQWFHVPTKAQYVIGEVDEEGHKIFEAFYGIPVTPAPYPEFQYFVSRKTRVKAVTKDDDTTAYAKFAVDQYNKKRERKEKRRFLKEMADKLEQEKKKFVEKINGTLRHMVRPEDKGAILKVILAELESEMQFKEQDELLKFEAEETYVILPAQPKVGESSVLPAVQKVFGGVQIKKALKEWSPNQEWSPIDWDNCHVQC